MSRNVSRRPIGAPSHDSATGNQERGFVRATATMKTPTNETHAPSGKSRMRKDADSSAPQQQFAAAEESGYQAASDPGAGEKAVLPGTSKRRSGQIGGRLRKKLAKERAAVSQAGKEIAAAS